MDDVCAEARQAIKSELHPVGGAAVIGNTEHRQRGIPLRCLNPCVMSWAIEALVLVTSQTSSNPTKVSCSHVVSISSSTTTGRVCWSSVGRGGTMVVDGLVNVVLESLLTTQTGRKASPPLTHLRTSPSEQFSSVMMHQPERWIILVPLLMSSPPTRSPRMRNSRW
ncbi:hypothetical protein PIB30_022070 [Stylosanthes scabra]|uniref:Uncharacterized protein n=1 Tax=Stylosanthes scabra TaxID=79078 RepID=A0ABU6Q900_9FABA|nr:hypothetical protein [Stylosanthes scabra]